MSIDSLAVLILYASAWAGCSRYPPLQAVERASQADLNKWPKLGLQCDASDVRLWVISTG